jgi:hypothetical protein
VSLTREDLTAISNLGQALWAREEESSGAALETLAAVTLLDLDADRAVERASQALVLRALRDGPRAAGALVHEPFFRLSIEERFILSALHGARWSYAKVAGILGIPAEQVEAVAWRSRVELGAARSVYPSGAKAHGRSCPDYDPSRPWTQRFLDDALKPREKLFLQDHLVACEPCRLTLQRCRTLYYAVDAIVPRTRPDSGEVARLERTVREMHYYRSPTERPFVESLRVFLNRPDIAWVLLGVGAVMILGFWLRG